MDVRPGDEGRPEVHAHVPSTDAPTNAPTDSLTSEPPVFGTPKASTISLTGADEHFGDFFRGLGPRRMKVALTGVGGTLLVIALVAALR